MAHLTPAQLERGVICASAGNHAQGVAMSAKRLGVRAVIVMPTTTPQLKIDAVKSLGGGGAVWRQLLRTLTAIRSSSKGTGPDLRAPVRRPRRDCRTRHDCHGNPAAAAKPGQQPAQCGVCGDWRRRAGQRRGQLHQGRAARGQDHRRADERLGRDDPVRQGAERVTLPDVGLFSDGTAVKLVGEETFRIASGLVDEFITVDTDAVCAAIKDVFVDTRSIVEPAGALAVAAIKQYVDTHHTEGETYAAILCGANMNFDRLRFVAERARGGRRARSPVRHHHP